MTFSDFLDHCNPAGLGAFGEYLFGAELIELGHTISRVNAGGADFLLDGILVDVKATRAGGRRGPRVDTTDGVLNIYMRIVSSGAEIYLDNEVVKIDLTKLERRFFEYTRGAELPGATTESSAAQKAVVDDLKSRFPMIKFVRRFWDATQRRMCRQGWAPQAFFIRPHQRYEGAVLVFFCEGTVEVQFVFAYRRTEINDIQWTRKGPGGLNVTFDLKKLGKRFRFRDVGSAVAYIISRSPAQC